MNYTRTADITESIARIISFVFHPFLMPVYGMIIILSAPTLFNYIPFGFKKLLILTLLINNVMLPLSLLPFFIHSNLISSWMLYERKDRIIPLFVSTVLYGVTAYIIFRFPVPFFLKSYILGITLLSLVLTVINFRWKISIHAAGAGILVAITMILSFRMYTPLLWYIVASVIAGGMVLSSRLKLDLHDPPEVWAGFFTGLTALTLFLFLF